MKPKKLSLTGFPTIDRTIKAENKIISDYDAWLKSEECQQEVEKVFIAICVQHPNFEDRLKIDMYEIKRIISAILSTLTKESEV